MSNRTLPIVSTGRIRDERRLLQIFNNLVEHWNTLNVGDITDITVNDETITEAAGVGYTSPGGVVAKRVTINDANVKSTSYLGFAPDIPEPLPVEFWVSNITDGSFDISWPVELYAAHGHFDTNNVVQTITSSVALCPLESASITLNMSLASNAVTITFGGLYRLTADILMGNVDVAGILQFQYRINTVLSGTLAQVPTETQSSNQSIRISEIFQLNAGDVIDIATASTGATYTNAEFRNIDFDILSMYGNGTVWTSQKFKYVVIQ